jgi:hypothetical protein
LSTIFPELNPFGVRFLLWRLLHAIPGYVEIYVLRDIAHEWVAGNRFWIYANRHRIYGGHGASWGLGLIEAVKGKAVGRYYQLLRQFEDRREGSGDLHASQVTAILARVLCRSGKRRERKEGMVPLNPHVYAHFTQSRFMLDLERLMFSEALRR